ncbi:hypothetical protein V8E51_017882 [Hyaloscypha variabilis]
MEQTFTCKYDSNGDVELVVQEKMENAVGQFQSPDVLAKMVRFSLSGVCLRARLWVSSQQLISSSEYFQRMLEDTAFPEGKKLKGNGVVQIQLSELEDKMITFLLSLIFCIRGKAIYLLMSTLRCCTIPQWLWTNTSGKHWSLPRARTWFHALVRDTGLPVHFSPSLMKWLWVTWLFGLEDHFRQLSKVAQQDARNSIVPTGEAIRLPYGVLHKYSFLLPRTHYTSPETLSWCKSEEAINRQRTTAFRRIEHLIQKLLNNKMQLLVHAQAQIPEDKMFSLMAMGHTSFYLRHLELAEFAKDGHVGSSIRLLSDRVDSFPSMANFSVVGPHGSSTWILPGTPFDLKSELQGFLAVLRTEEWGLDYNMFKPSPVAQ